MTIGTFHKREECLLETDFCNNSDFINKKRFMDLCIQNY